MTGGGPDVGGHGRIGTSGHPPTFEGEFLIRNANEPFLRSELYNHKTRV